MIKTIYLIILLFFLVILIKCSADYITPLASDNKDSNNFDLELSEKFLNTVEFAPQLNHTQIVNVLDISDDGKDILSGSIDGTVKLWDVKNKSIIRSFFVNPLPVLSAKFTKIPDIIAVIYIDYSLVFYNTKSGKLIQRQSLPTQTIFSRDLNYLIYNFSANLRITRFTLYDIRTVKEYFIELRTNSLIDIEQLKKNYKAKTSKSPKDVQTFNSSLGKKDFLTLSSDKRKLFLLNDRNDIEIIDLLTGNRLFTLVNSIGSINSFLISQDNKFLLLSGNNKSIVLWDLSTYSEIKKYSGLHYPAFKLFWSEKSNFFYSVGSDIKQKTNGEIIYWSPNGEIVDSYSLNTSITNAIKVPDRDQLYIVDSNSTFLSWMPYNEKSIDSFGDRTHTLYDFATDENNSLYCTYYKSNFQQNAIQDSELVKIDLKSLSVKDVVKDDDGYACDLEFNKSNTPIISFCSDNMLRIWNKKPLSLASSFKLGDNPPVAVRYSSKNNKLCTIFSNGNVNIHTLNGSLIKQNVFSAKAKISSLEINNRGTAFFGTLDKSIYVYDLSKLKIRKILESLDGIPSYIKSTDENDIIFVGYNDGRIVSYDVKNDSVIKLFEGHNLAITKLDLLKNGSVLISSSFDGTIKLWNISSGMIMQEIENNQSSMVNFSLSNKGYGLITSSVEGIYTLWNIESGDELLHFFRPSGKDIIIYNDEYYYSSNKKLSKYLTLRKGNVLNSDDENWLKNKFKSKSYFLKTMRMYF